ncbi:hypothetical protein AVEN_66214-1 [Araneus ventricosus]|uniref:Uncharacterized protein n=1 Tax=Araneus ventricosus TaxID=182803 RepID=A0A4Y2GYZ2_ARAVE|nr:hypothetical protein AVEN_66214-1 [Araneus ventricosus]
MVCSLDKKISDRRNISSFELMYYPNCGRKHDAAVVTVDVSSLLNKNSLIQQDKIIMTRPFGEEGESLSNSSLPEEALEDKYLKLHEKLEKAIHSETKLLCRSTSKNSSLSKIVKQEFQLFD